MTEIISFPIPSQGVDGSALMPSSLTWDDHDRLLSALEHPLWLAEGSTLLDHRWSVLTDNPTKKRQAVQPIDFDVVIAPNRERLTDLANLNYLIVAKLAMYFDASLLRKDGYLSSGAPQRCAAFVALIRWMRRNEIREFRFLSEAWYKKYTEDMTRFGGLLVDVQADVDRYIAEVRTGARKLPTRSRHHTGFILWTGVLEDLGLFHGKHLNLTQRAAIARLALEEGVKIEQRVARAFAGQEPAVGRAAPAVEDEEGESGDLGGAQMSGSHVAHCLRPWEHLWAIRGRYPIDPVKFRAFDGQRTISSERKRLGRTEARTPKIPDYQACFLVDRALRWVLQYSEDVFSLFPVFRQLESEQIGHNIAKRKRAIELLKMVNMKHVGADALGAPWPLPEITNPANKSGAPYSFHYVAFTLLPAACLIVLAFFSARRREELNSLQHGCVTFDEDGAWLSVWIEKTLRDIDRIPVPATIVKAVEILEKLSAEAAQVTEIPWLFQFKYLSEKVGVVSFVPDWINEFAEFVGVPPLLDGSRWRFSPHQFRKFFAIAYMHRFEYASLTALQQFLGHADPNVTRGYYSEVAAGSYTRLAEQRGVEAKHRQVLKRVEADCKKVEESYAEASQSFQIARFTSVALGKENICGAGGEEYKKLLLAMREEARRLVRVMSAASVEEGLQTLIEQFVEGKTLEPCGNGHAYCKCGNTEADLAAASCIAVYLANSSSNAMPENVAPNPALATEQTCDGCAHDVEFQENERYYLKRIEDEGQLAERGIAPALREAAKHRCDRLKDHHRRCYVQSKPLPALEEE